MVSLPERSDAVVAERGISVNSTRLSHWSWVEHAVRTRGVVGICVRRCRASRRARDLGRATTGSNRSTTTGQCAWRMGTMDEVDLQDELLNRVPMLKRCPHFLRGRMRECSAVALRQRRLVPDQSMEIVRSGSEDVVAQTTQHWQLR